MGVVGGNFAKTFLNLNKRKFGAQSCLNPCPLAPARYQAAMAHVRRGATFLMQLISALSKRQGRAGREGGDCKPAVCEDKVFKPGNLESGSRQRQRQQRRRFVFLTQLGNAQISVAACGQDALPPFASSLCLPGSAP